VDCFKEAIRLEEQQASFYLNRALAYARIGATEDVLPDLQRALELNPLLVDLVPTLKPLEYLADDPRFEQLVG
jgi:tetratricopeptide (TPR) repeat protein